jgi:hypothetical protein
MIATLPLDIARLEKARHTGSKVTSRCPACAATGGDKSGTHFFMNSATGKFGCAAFPGDTAHRREIFALVGIRQDRDPDIDIEWKRQRALERREEVRRANLAAAVRRRRADILATYPWSAAEVRRESPEQRLEIMHDPRKFIAAMFPEDAVVWTGEVYHSGRNHAAHWRTAEAWQHAPENEVGPMLSPAIWNPGTVSRAAANVMAAPYVALDFDGLDGISPKTPVELAAHIAGSLATVRWLRERLEWSLAAVLWTGGKSIHAWFHTPPPAALRSLRDTAGALGIDAGLVGRPEHPCRLPGQRHQKTGKLSQTLWLIKPTTTRP